MDKHVITTKSSASYKNKSALHEHVRQMLMLERLCNRFHLVVQQLLCRHENRPTIRIEDEYDLHDLFLALLKLEHDIVEEVNWTPAYNKLKSHSDFYLRMQQIAIVTKKTSAETDTLEIKEQIPVDIQQFNQKSGCRTLLIFIYDPELRIANPRGFENENSNDEGEFPVRVIISPKGI